MIKFLIIISKPNFKIMKRRNLIKGLGAIGLGSMLPLTKTSYAIEETGKILLTEKQLQHTSCWLTPALTEGPYYLNANLVRQDITEGKPGMPFHLTINVINFECQPIPNVLVDIWHADKDGNYSGFNAFVGQTFLRGTQPTNANGTAVFDSIYPGWYPGRATHIHFKVRLNSFTYVTSQFCFLDSINNLIYATPLYSGRGPNPTTNATDAIFHNSNPQYLVMDVTANTSGGYDGNYTIGINAPVGINENTSQPDGFVLKQNFPNPFNPETTIQYFIPVSTHVKLNVYDGFGKEVVTLIDKKQLSGSHEIKFDGRKLSSGYYFYKLTAGDFVQTKEMLLIK